MVVYQDSLVVYRASVKAVRVLKKVKSHLGQDSSDIPYEDLEANDEEALKINLVMATYS